MSRLICSILACALTALTLIPLPAQANQPQAVKVISFTLSRTEAAKGEQVVAHWSFTGRARKMSIATGATDGVLLGYTWPISRPANSGALTFTVPLSLYTLSPLLVVLVVDGQFLNSVPLLIRCDNPWFFTPRAERCPSMPIEPSPAAMQTFENGRMIWIGDRNSVYVFYNPGIASVDAGRWEIFEDRFRDGDPETDPAFTPPAGKLQPKRGFGLVWRANPRVRQALGWALDNERGYTACFGGGFGGWKSFTSYLNDADNRIMQLQTYYMPTTWQPFDTNGGRTVSFTGCS